MEIPFVSFKTMNHSVKAEMVKSFETFFDNAYYILGEQVKLFEDSYASFNKVDHCVGISNGLDALHIALKALDIKAGDEVIVPSNTFIATCFAVSYTGATPVFVEPDNNTCNIDPELIEEAITKNTKAIIPVHLYGQACDMEKITAVCNKYGLPVIEDNAQAHGASFKNKLTGSWGAINATSFYPGKNLGALGDAGAITTNDAELAKKARILRNYGSDKKYYHKSIGYNMRLDECQAGFLSVKLKHLEAWTQQRQQIAAVYSEGLKNIGGIKLPSILPGATHVYHQYVIRTESRDKLQEYLLKNGVGTLIHYPVPPHLQEAYKYLGFSKGSFPVAEDISGTCLSLPIWPGMERGMVDYVILKIKSFFNE